MPKNLVFGADGTWNKPTGPADFIQGNSNVVKLRNCLVNDGVTQIVQYDDGVGADGNILERALGGAFGLGLFQKVKDAYSFFAGKYAVGDSIYIFGFSRGAYTARSVAGMIALCGLPTTNLESFSVDQAFDAYRERDPNRQKAKLDALNAAHDMDDAKITMLGIWETIGSLGIPAIFGLVDPLIYGFLNTHLHPDVRNAYQGLALDEARPEFRPSLWDSPPANGQTIEQVWFAGVHTDVGGGSQTGYLSTIPLVWMMRAAQKNGILFDPANAEAQRYLTDSLKDWIYDVINDSWSRIIWGLPIPRSIPNGATISDSVQIRVLNDTTYHPDQFNPPSLLDGHPILTIVGPAASA
jgi:uncharacterized protein (DUF2235 family)